MAPTGKFPSYPSGSEIVQVPKYSPERMQQIEQLRGSIEPGALKGADFLSKIAGGDQSMFEQMEAPAMRQFEQLQGKTASRFSGLGMGSRRSSGFENTMSGHATDLAERLQGKRMGFQQNAIKQLMELYGNMMKDDPYQMYFQDEDEGDPWGGAMSGAISGATIGSSLLPGWGTAIGGALGGLGGYFGGKKGSKGLRGIDQFGDSTEEIIKLLKDFKSKE